jgi:H+/Na+-translocating ferredoxin:NAD+ oxidoreductase subunit C
VDRGPVRACQGLGWSDPRRRTGTEGGNLSSAAGRAVRAHGIRLQGHKAESTRAPLESAPLPNELVLPLEAGVAARDFHPAVETGQRVLRGQPLVRGGGPLSTWTHASTSGVVRSLETRPVGHARRREALCAVVEVDGEDALWPELEPPDPLQWKTPDALAAALSRAGLAGLGGAVFPSGVKLAAALRRPMRAVIVNGAECEPYISCDDMLMRTSAREVVAGAMMLVALTGAQCGFVVIEEDKPEALRALEREMSALGAEEPLTLATVPAIYPAGGERQLVERLTGHEVPSLARPTDIGYLCQNVGTAVALGRFLRFGRPVTSRVTTITGGGIAQPRNLDVRLGTRIADLVIVCGGYSAPVARLIVGGSMMGLAIGSDAVPVTRATNCVIAATASEVRRDTDALPCIRCGACSAACPANLLPQELNHATEHGRLDALEEQGLFDCIECGCCDVVCPSEIRITEHLRLGKQQFVQAMGLDARVRWFDQRERLRRERVERFEAAHAEDAPQAPPPLRQRLEAAADVIARVSRVPVAAET